MRVSGWRGWLAPLCLAVFLSSCGSDDGSISLPVGNEDQIHMQIDRLEKIGELPSLDRSDSLAGIDADGDGVRDDIQEWLRQLPVTPVQLAAIRQLVRADQQAILVNPQDEPALRQAIAAQVAAVKCVVRNEIDILNGQNIVTIVRDRTANTEIRALAYMRYMEALNGYVVKSPDGNGCQNG